VPVGEGEDIKASSPSIHLKETKHSVDTLLALLVLKLASVLASERVPETLTQDQLILTFKTKRSSFTASSITNFLTEQGPFLVNLDACLLITKQGIHW
jgi:hypothetical protein